MNKEKLEEMILEELMLEADDGEEYKTLALELFPNIAKRTDGISYLKRAFPNVNSLKIEKNRLENAKIQIGSIDNEDFDFNNDKIDGDQKDKELYNNIVNNRKAAVSDNPDLEIKTFDELLTAAASSSEESPDDGTSSDSESSTTTGPASETGTETTTGAADTAAGDGPETATTSTTDTGDDSDTTGADTDAGTTDSEEVEVDPDRFVPTQKVKDAVEAMKGFYDKPYLHEQGELLRDLIKAIEAALKGEDREAGITSRTSTLPLQEAKGLNIKNIKASLNAFLQQTRKVKKALQEYIAMAGKAKVGAKRKKGILDKEVDQLIEYGKMILKSLPKTISEAEEAETNPETTTEESNVDLQPLHDFITFILGNELGSSNKDDVQGKLEKVKKILKVFPNVAPFGSADGTELDEYENKFKEAIDTHLKTAIANFKSLNSAEGGEAAIEGLRTALIQFLGDGLTILGKGVDGNDIKDLGSDEAISFDDETAPVSNLSPETIMSELGLDSDKKISADSDDKAAFKIMAHIFGEFRNKRYNKPEKIENYIYDYVKKDEDNILKKLFKGTLRRLPFNLRESNENQNFKDKFSENFIKKIKEMYVNWKNNVNKNELRTAAKELAEYSNEMLKKYQKLSDNKGDPNTGKKLSDMFTELYNQHGSTQAQTYVDSETNKKVSKALKLINDNIDKVDYKIFLKTLSKIYLKDLDDTNLRTMENTSERIFEKPHFINHFKINSVKKNDNGDLVFVGSQSKFDNQYPTYPFKKDNLDEITTSISDWWNNLSNLNLQDYEENDLAYTLLELKNEILEKKYKIFESFKIEDSDGNEYDYNEGEKVQIASIEEGEEGTVTVALRKDGYELKINYDAVSLTHDLEMISNVTESKNHKIQFKLEKLVENYINKRKQQWRKRTM